MDKERENFSISRLKILHSFHLKVEILLFAPSSAGLLNVLCVMDPFGSQVKPADSFLE